VAVIAGTLVDAGSTVRRPVPDARVSATGVACNDAADKTAVWGVLTRVRAESRHPSIEQVGGTDKIGSAGNIYPGHAEGDESWRPD
jgi:hypothetical protein